MAIVLVLAVLWGVVLIPAGLRKLQSRGSNQSIDSFHRSLHLLETSGPKIVQPAYRLAAGGGTTTPVVARPAGVIVTPRPQLVLLRPNGQGGEGTMQDFDDEIGSDDRYDDGYDDRYDDGYGEDRHGEHRVRTSPRPGASRPANDQARREAAHRRRTILLSLVGAVVVTMLGGFVASFLWDLTVVAVIALVAYVALMAWAATHATSTSTSSRVTERHIAHATAFEQEYDDVDRRPYVDEGVVDFDSDWDGAGDGWWDQPRRAAAR